MDVVVCPAEPPSITEASPSVMKAAFSRSVNLTCRAFGAPTPVIRWTRGEASTWSVELWSVDHANKSDAVHFVVDDAGTLTIQVTATMNILCTYTLANHVLNYLQLRHEMQ